MAKRHSRETILVRWTIDEGLWRDFLIKKQTLDRSGMYTTYTPPTEFPVLGIEVAIRDDAIFVHRSCVREFVFYGGHHGISVRDSQLEISGNSDTGNDVYLLPIARSALAEVTRISERFTAADAEAIQVRAEEDARPTLRNRLLKWVEAHFACATIIFFFGVIPLIAFCIYWLVPVFRGE